MNMVVEREIAVALGTFSSYHHFLSSNFSRSSVELLFVLNKKNVCQEKSHPRIY